MQWLFDWVTLSPKTTKLLMRVCTLMFQNSKSLLLTREIWNGHNSRQLKCPHRHWSIYNGVEYPCRQPITNCWVHQTEPRVAAKLTNPQVFRSKVNHEQASRSIAFWWVRLSDIGGYCDRTLIEAGRADASDTCRTQTVRKGKFMYQPRVLVVTSCTGEKLAKPENQRLKLIHGMN
jgi:hypothetical protein